MFPQYVGLQREEIALAAAAVVLSSSSSSDGSGMCMIVKK